MFSGNTPCIYLSLIPGLSDLIHKEDNSGSDNYDTDNYESNFLKLNKVECKTSNNQVYKVIRYDKNFLNNSLLSTYGLCRSIILNKNNSIVSFAPPKAILSETFMTRYPELNSNIVIEEFVEGTMINVFWDPLIGLSGGWEIATRNTVGATSTFYKSAHSKSFREMFLEATKENNLQLEQLNKQFCYSFVLQHKENRIVVPFNRPQLYLVAVYYIYHTDPKNMMVYLIDINEVKKFGWNNTSVKFPEIYTMNSYTDAIHTYASMNTPYNILGVVLKNSLTGVRAKIRNPVYEQVRKLRGNQPKLQYQYLSLRQEGKVGDFLKFYPENKKEFSVFRDQVHLFTNTLFSNYISCYIKKEKPLIEFSDQYRTHMFHIHKKYMDEMREKKLFIKNTDVIHYVNGLQPSLLMFCLNFQMRQRRVDYIAADYL